MSISRGVAIPAPARRAFAAVQAVSPALASRLAERWFFTPPQQGLPGPAEALLQTGRRFRLVSDGRPVVTWSLGREAGPTVYLVHGWGGRGGRLGGFAEPLVEAGYHVVTFDAPGHGDSGRGLSSMPEFARALRVVVERHGPAHAIIAHSLGASATALAAGWGLEAKRYALLAPAADPTAFADAFASALGARPDVMARARASSERRLRFSWDELDVRAVAARMTASAFIVHDHTDDVVPFAEGAAIAAAWPKARMLATTGLGHRGVVRDAQVVNEVVQFVTDAAALPPSAGARLEHELFYRETRRQ
jgi:pimeloyl-ACP methyl ester carboxylesterase